MNGLSTVALINNEIIQLTSLMRKNARWAQSGVAAILGGAQDDTLAGRWGLRSHKSSKVQDNPMMAAFNKLRLDLQDCQNIADFDTPALLHPFLLVVRSSSTSGPITSLALVAINKFFNYRIIHSDSPRLALAMQLLSSAITHCRFEASDSAQDEVVLLRILRLMESIINGVGGNLLADESVCELMETALSMCCQARLSEILRRSAELTMISMCQNIFERLSSLPTGDGVVGEYKIEPEVFERAVRRSSMEPESTSMPGDDVDGSGIGKFSVSSVQELLRVLVLVLDPSNKQYTDSTRMMAIRIIDVAVEVGGLSLSNYRPLLRIITEDLCRFVFQLVRSDNALILSSSLRLMSTLLHTTRRHLKLQQELFLSYLVTCLQPRGEIPREPGIDPILYEGVPNAPRITQMSSGRSTPVPVKEQKRLMPESGARTPDTRETMVECIGGILRIPSFMVELFVNYDCEVDRTDLCEDVIGFLARNSFPDAANWSTPNVPPLCLDALLAFVGFLADRLDDVPNTNGLPTARSLAAQRQRKQIIIKGASKFNEKPKLGIDYFAAHGIIDADRNPVSVAKVLVETNRINKTVLGEFLAKPENKPIMDAFIESFDFSGNRVDEALRKLLVSFRLPGESQQIDRIVEKFAAQYQASETTEIANADAGYLLAYSIIMLNVDQHNPKVKRRMTVEDYTRNVRGGNDNKDFPPEYLQQIFSAISSREIIMPEEHDNQAGLEYAWKELLQKVESAGELMICDTNIYDAMMFDATWKPLVAALSYVFMSATDDAVFSRVVTGFDQCARIASKYELSDAMDHIVICLSLIGTLSTEAGFNTSLNARVQVEESLITVSELAVRFGRDFKAQLATVVLFRMCTGNEHIIKQGWKQICQIWINLFINSLIAPHFAPQQDSFELDPIPILLPSAVINRQQSQASLFSALSSYLSSYAADEAPEPSDEELDSALCTFDCIRSCQLGEIFGHLTELGAAKTKYFMRAIFLHMRRLQPDPETQVTILRPERPPTPNPNGRARDTPHYDPALVYLLELATCFVVRSEDDVDMYAKDLVTELESVISQAKHLHQITTSRSIYYVLTVYKASAKYNSDTITLSRVLRILNSVDIGILKFSARETTAGLLSCVKASECIRKAVAESSDFWNLFQNLTEQSEFSSRGFELLDFFVRDRAFLNESNYGHIIGMLNEYAQAAAVGAPHEQRQDGAGKRGKPVVPNPHAEVIARATRSVQTIFEMQHVLAKLAANESLSPEEAWAKYWYRYFEALCQQCINPCREVRIKAFNSLQRTFLSNTIPFEPAITSKAIFNDVILGLISNLLKPEIYHTDPRGMIQTRGHAATLLCKVFLHYLSQLNEWEGMRDLWLSILDYMDRLMHSGQRDHGTEAIAESLKNVILVMSTAGFLVPPETGKDELDLWQVTWQKVDRILPELQQQLFPKRVEEERKVSTGNPPKEG